MTEKECLFGLQCKNYSSGKHSSLFGYETKFMRFISLKQAKNIASNNLSKDKHSSLFGLTKNDRERTFFWIAVKTLF